MLRIIGGEYKRRLLIEPGPGENSRPYQDRVREAVFNLLRGWCDDANVLDLFAGVGSMGLEAVSRGAARVVMVEQNRETYRRLQENIDELGCGDRAEAVQGDALGPLVIARAPRPVDLLFMDPPFAMIEDEAARQLVFAQMTRCAAIMKPGGFAVLRTPFGPRDDEGGTPLEIEGWLGPEPHHYGRVNWVMLYQVEREEEARSE